MIRGSVFFISMMFVIIPKAFSQGIGSIITDRPDVTESAFTIPKKHIQIETGTVYSNNKFNVTAEFNDTLINFIQTEEFLNLPGFLARYGLSNSVELRLGAQLTFNRSGSGDQLYESSFQTDIDGIEIAVKFKLSEQEKYIPSIAVIAGSALPPVSTNFFSDFKLQPALIFCFDNEITEDFGAGYNLGVNFSDWLNTYSSSGIYSLSLDYSVNNVIGMFCEFYGEVPFSNNMAMNYADAGITFLIKKNLQLDFSVGYGLNSGITEYFLNSGISIRLPE